MSLLCPLFCSSRPSQTTLLGPVNFYKYSRFAALCCARVERHTRPSMPTPTETARQAIAALQSLPHWEKIAQAYGNAPVHLADLLDDLELNEWEEL